MSEPLFAGGPTGAENIFLQELPASFGASIRASARHAFETNPTTLIYQWMDRERVDEEASISTPRLSRVVPAAEARERVQKEKLDLTIPDEGIRERALDDLIEMKYQERVRQDTISRGPGGFGAGAAQFGAGLGVSLLDPLNIASAFIPVVGELRYAKMLQSAGASAFARAGVRARVGAVEGAAGAAALEPLVYGLAQELQKDYTAMDSLMNLAFGTILGGGLHVGVGAVRDHVSRGGAIETTPARPGTTGEVIARMSPEERINIARVALAQAIDGRPVEVDAFVNLQKDIRELAAAEAKPGFLRTADDLIALAKTERSVAVAEGVRIENTPGFLRSADDLIAQRAIDKGETQADLNAAARRERVAEEIKGKSDEEVAGMLARLITDQEVRQRLLADKKQLTVAAKERKMKPEALRERVEEQMRHADAEIEAYRALGKEASPETVRARVEQGSTRVQEAAARVASPEARVNSDDLAASEEARVSLEETKTGETQTEAEVQQKAMADEERELKEMLKAMESDADVKKMFEAEDERIARVDEQNKMMRALALCQLRKS